MPPGPGHSRGGPAWPSWPAPRVPCRHSRQKGCRARRGPGLPPHSTRGSVVRRTIGWCVGPLTIAWCLCRCGLWRRWACGRPPSPVAHAGPRPGGPPGPLWATTGCAACTPTPRAVAAHTCQYLISFTCNKSQIYIHVDYRVIKFVNI